MALVGPGDLHSPARWVLVALVLVPFMLARPASAATTPPGSSQTVGECLAADGVWLHVQTETGEVLRSECVGNPATGLEALRAAEIVSTEAKGGYLCTLAGHPEHCPTGFGGQYWQYSHAGGLGTGWTYAKKGPGERRPTRGGIEGWCYNARNEQRCALPELAAADAAAGRVDHASLQRTSNNLWAIGVLVAALALTAAWIRRRT